MSTVFSRSPARPYGLRRRVSPYQAAGALRGRGSNPVQEPEPAAESAPKPFMRPDQEDPIEEAEPPPRRITVFGREYTMPRSRRARIAIGSVLIVLGMFGFLPVLGFWMVPLGLLVLSYEFATVRRWRRRFGVWWATRRGRRRTNGR